MLYSSQICPFWSRAGARLGKDSLTAPGAHRGTRPALLGFLDYELLLPQDVPVESARLLYTDLVEDVNYREPQDLADQYAAALAAEPEPAGERAYWTNTNYDVRALAHLLERGRKKLQKTEPLRLLQTPDGDPYASFEIPLFASQLT